MQESSSLFQRALRCIPGGVNSPVRAFRAVGGEPFFTRKADGAVLTTVEGRDLIDYVCTWGPAIHGHNHPAVREAVALALESGTSFGTPHADEVVMAELLCRIVPGVERVRMVNSGTEATMSAIRLARGFTGRSRIAKFAGCYHGHVDALLVKAGSGALTLGAPDSAGIPASVAAETVVLPFNDPEALERAFAEHELAAVILEPYPANCGLILPEPGFLELVRARCTEAGTVLIFDEVMTGFRVALGGVQERVGITADLVTLGKIIGGGLPVGAFGGREAIMRCLAPEGPVYQAGTLSGNPLALAAGLASLRLLCEQPPYVALERLGGYLRAGLLAAARSKGLPLEVPQVGAMFALFFREGRVRHFGEVLESDAALFAKVFRYALEHGVYLPPSAYETCFLSTAHTQQQVEQTVAVLGEAIRRL